MTFPKVYRLDRTKKHLEPKELHERAWDWISGSYRMQAKMKAPWLDKEELPLWGLHSSDEVLWYSTKWSGPKEQMATVDILRTTLRIRRHVESYVFICEMWATVTTNMDKLLNQHMEEEENRPTARRESKLMIFTVHRSGEKHLTFAIINEFPGKPTTLGPRADIDDLEVGDWKGRMFESLFVEAKP
jgi:hypothetical protein